MSEKMVYGDTGMNIIRIVCGYLLHQQVVNELIEGKQMMGYVKRQAHKFTN
jgi:hypothetical protein